MIAVKHIKYGYTAEQLIWTAFTVVPMTTVLQLCIQAILGDS